MPQQLIDPSSPVAAALLPRPWQRDGRIAHRQAWRIATYALTWLLAAGWTVHAGKDLSWDFINYHLYAGFSALHDRFGQDFLAAGQQGYLNPYSHVPVYLMVAAGWPAIVIGLVLATMQVGVVWLAFELTAEVGGHDGRFDPLWPAFAAALAAINPVFLFGLGTSSNDASIGVLVLGSWLLALRGVRRGAWRLVAAGGLLAGIATALKMSNALFVVAAMPMLALAGSARRPGLRVPLLFGAGSLVAFVLVSLPWAMQLWQVFGNPMFPMMNTVFMSPDLPVVPTQDHRFLSEGLVDALLRPLTMALPGGLRHFEAEAVDTRMLLLGFVAIVAAIQAVAKRPVHPGPNARPPDGAGRSRSIGVALAVGFVAAWCLWLAVSGNARYFIAMSCVAAVLLAVLLARLGGRTLHWTLLLVLGGCTLQAWHLLALNEQLRLAGRSWNGPWVDLRLPQTLREQPALYLNVSAPSAGFMATQLPPQSGVVGISGIQSVAPDSPGGPRVAALMARYAGRVRTLEHIGSVAADAAVDEVDAARAHRMDQRLAPWALRVDRAGCEYIRLRMASRKRTWPGLGLVDRPEHDDIYASCPTVPSTALAAQYWRERRHADAIFVHAEAACAALFSPAGLTSEWSDGFWYRIYPDTDKRLTLTADALRYLDMVRGGESVVLGTPAEWHAAALPERCLRRAPPPFGMQSLVH